MREIALYGSQVVKVTGSYDQAKQIASEFARQRNLYQDLGARTITCIEAMKTIAYEIAEQLTAIQGPASLSGKDKAIWCTPDWYVQAVSGGIGPLGVYKGFRELKQMGLVDRIPAIAAIQAEGCAPMVSSFKQGLETAIPVSSPKTNIETLATGDPGRSYWIPKAPSKVSLTKKLSAQCMRWQKWKVYPWSQPRPWPSPAYSN
jgi:threonine synthase